MIDNSRSSRDGDLTLEPSVLVKCGTQCLDGGQLKVPKVTPYHCEEPGCGGDDCLRRQIISERTMMLYDSLRDLQRTAIFAMRAGASICMID
ncbi:hypothetical protein DPMN_120941 [Dreissena polymorpha]|uniref:Uncharacterized protein n=1 Tax=Dreissena polymorpha TaxID=45954 RepID=A0A9D4GPA2_DREPO|nr:hypothetical protein DPMN_120941 [Dreissena polymorpha]